MAGSTISSWFDFPFLEKSNHALTEAVGLSWLGGKEVTDFHHVYMAGIVFTLLVILGLSFKKGLAVVIERLLCLILTTTFDLH